MLTCLFIFRILIKQEELYLQNKFGEEYINYKNKVSLLFTSAMLHGKSGISSKYDEL